MRSTVFAAIALSLCALLGGSLALTLTAPTNSPENYTFTYREPRGCKRTAGKCKYFVAIQKNAKNPKYLDFYLEGKANGWVAIGFSTTKKMYKSDTLGCIRNKTAVGVVDTWNPAHPSRQNKLDATQNDTIKNAVSYTNGRIICNFTRKAAITDEGQDVDLLANNYWHLYGIGPDHTSGTLPKAFNYHRGATPTISSAKVNITRSEGQVIQAQGLLVTTTVSVIAVTAVFFAA